MAVGKRDAIQFATRLHDDRVPQVKEIFLSATLCLGALVAYFFLKDLFFY